MSEDYTTTGLIKSVKRRAAVPTSQQLFTNTEILDFANDEMRSLIVPLIISMDEEYFIKKTDITLDPNESRYPIPSDASAITLRYVSFLANSPAPPNQIAEVEIPRLTVEDIAGYGSAFGNIYTFRMGFYVEGNDMVLFPGANNNPGIMRVRYPRRVNYLVPVSSAGQIRSIDTINNTIVLSNVPTTFTVNTSICAVSSLPPFETVISAQDIVSVSAPTIGLTDVSELSVGDWICLEGESTIPQIPLEAFDILNQITAVKVLESIGADSTKITIAQKKYEEVRDQLITLMTPRDSGQVLKVTTSGRGIADRVFTFPWSSGNNRGA